MKKTAYRFAFTIGAVLLGILVIVVFTFLGKSSKGPIEDLFASVGSKVIDLENEILLSNREPGRAKQLNWFDKYRNTKGLLQSPDTVFYGVYDNHYQKSFSNIVDLEDKLQTQFSIIQVYNAWGDKPEERFPTTYAKAIYNLGSIPLITWEPWLNDFVAEDYGLQQNDNPDKNGLLNIARGNYDPYIDKWALELKDFGKPVFVRWGHEMNDPYRYPWGPQNNRPKDFIAAWQHIVNRFKELEVNNVLWVWSPHPSYGLYQEFFPGGEFVDWVGVGALNYGTVALWSKWWGFDEIFGNYYKWLSMFNKPIMVTEFGSLSVGGNRQEWYAKALDSIPEKYPNLKAVLFFNNNSDNTTLNKTLDWSLNNDSLSVFEVKKIVGVKMQ